MPPPAAPARRPRRRALLALAGALALYAPSSAAAGDTNYQDYALGGRAVGLGGAFVALADDPSGVFYNPAGLVDASRSSMQLSSNFYGLEIATTGNLITDVARQLVDFERVFSELSIIPSSAGFLELKGDRLRDGRARHAYGAGVFVPTFSRTRIRSVSTGPDERQRVFYRHHVDDRVLRPMMAYAYRVDEDLRFGVSASVSYRSLQDREESSLVEGLDDQQQSFRTSATDLDLWTASLLLTLGVKLSLDERWLLGGTVTAPSVHLADGASLEVMRTLSNPSIGSSEVSVSTPGDLEARMRSGVSARVGAAYVDPGNSTSTVDMSIHAPTRYTLLDLGGEPVPGLTLLTKIERRAVVNIAVGHERIIWKRFSLAAGAYTNLSSAPNIPGEEGDLVPRAYLADVFGLGGSLVAGVFSDHTLTRIGGTATYGVGSDVIPSSEALLPLGTGGTFRKIAVTRLFLYFFISSTFRY